MERGRLESEFRKLKESKKKAEQYAVEAKQTAQRLSAENFKLREDLSKERHFNELTRKNMLREVELSVERGKSLAKTRDIRAEVFDEEVAKRAFMGRASTSLFKKGVWVWEEMSEGEDTPTQFLSMYLLRACGYRGCGRLSAASQLAHGGCESLSMLKCCHGNFITL